MSPAPAGKSPLRYVTPGMMVMCLLLFFLPWVEVQCNVSEKGGMDFGGAGNGNVKVTNKSSGPEWMTLASQSGYQIASGGVTVMGTAGGGAGKKSGGPAESGESAPLLWLYPL